MRLPGTFWCNQQLLLLACMKKKMMTITLSGFIGYWMRRGVVVTITVCCD
jgi:hypothetical protein